MPGMPFHMEKGHALTALEDLVNGPNTYASLRSAWDGLRDPSRDMGSVFSDIVDTAPTIKGYGGKVGTEGLGAFVAGAWFGHGTSSPYWLDYRGDVDSIVREALLLAIEVAWGVDRTQPLPADPAALDRSRRVELLWHCAQRWFDAWVLWDDPAGPVTVVFTTPPHTGGAIVDEIAAAEANGWATPVDATSVKASGDMVLVCQSQNKERPPRLRLEWSASGQIPLPAVGRMTVGTGAVAAYSIHADAGGMNPRTPWA